MFVLYGALSEHALPVSPDQVIFRHKQVTGFWLPIWMRQAGADKLADAWAHILSRPALFSPQIAGEFALEDVQAAIAAYTGAQGGRFSAGKVLLRPGRS
jgi:NADPH:quinone reductase-like Zn-dependent oxidoreductase